jgi:hypothetical protein
LVFAMVLLRRLPWGHCPAEVPAVGGAEAPP